MFDNLIVRIPVGTKFAGGGAMVQGKVPIHGRPANLENGRAWAYWDCGRCGWWLFGHFSLIQNFSLLPSVFGLNGPLRQCFSQYRPDID